MIYEPMPEPNEDDLTLDDLDYATDQFVIAQPIVSALQDAISAVYRASVAERQRAFGRDYVHAETANTPEGRLIRNLRDNALAVLDAWIKDA